MTTWLLDQTNRQRIYAILTALVPLLISYGVIGQEQAALWLALAAAVLGTGMATVFSGAKYGRHSAP